MKKKVILVSLLALGGISIFAGTAAVSKNNELKKEQIEKNDEIVKEVENKEEIEEIQPIEESDKNEESKTEEIVKNEKAESNKKDDEKIENNKKDNEKVENNTTKNEEKKDSEKEQTSKNPNEEYINNEIKKGQKLYDEKKYTEAKRFMNNLISLNEMTADQYKRAQDLFRKASEKEVEKDVTVNFSYEDAVKLLKKEIGDDGTKIFEYFQEDNGSNYRTFYITVSEKSNPIFGKIYIVSSSGCIKEAS